MGKKAFKPKSLSKIRRAGKNQRNSGTKKTAVGNKHVAEAWDHKKSMTKNLASFGLGANPNKIIPVQTMRQQLMAQLDQKDQDKLKVEEASEVTKPQVLEELEKQSKLKMKSKFRINEDTAQFCIYMLEIYGDENYKEMAKDKRNFYQDTPAQIKRKILSFMKATEQWNQYIALRDSLETEPDALKMLMFCPTCGNLLSVQSEVSEMKFQCQVCPYKYIIHKTIKIREHPSKKKLDDVLGGEEAWAAVQTTEYEGGCEKCGTTKAYFRMQQTRSADEPTTRFYRCTNGKCTFQWKEIE